MEQSAIIQVLEFDLHLVENKTPHRWALIKRYIVSLKALKQIAQRMRNGRRND
jgi:hypothetical protein